MTVFYSTPYKAGDIGGGINEFIELLPDDAWVCIRDADTLFLHSEQQPTIERICASDPPFDVISCMTNRLRSGVQCHEGKIDDSWDMRKHFDIAYTRLANHDTALMEVPWQHVAGMMLLFRKSTWHGRVFPHYTARFDGLWAQQIAANGGRFALAIGIYLWHSYRFGHADPANYHEHLKGAGV